jgi:hypothetical protein
VTRSVDLGGKAGAELKLKFALSLADELTGITLPRSMRGALSRLQSNAVVAKNKCGASYRAAWWPLQLFRIWLTMKAYAAQSHFARTLSSGAPPKPKVTFAVYIWKQYSYYGTSLITILILRRCSRCH